MKKANTWALSIGSAIATVLYLSVQTASATEPDPVTKIQVGTVFTVEQDIDLSRCADTGAIHNGKPVKDFHPVTGWLGAHEDVEKVNLWFSGGKSGCGKTSFGRSCMVEGQDRVLKKGTKCPLMANDFSNGLRLTLGGECDLKVYCDRDSWDPRSSPFSVSSLNYNLGKYFSFQKNANTTGDQRSVSGTAVKDLPHTGTEPGEHNNGKGIVENAVHAEPGK